MFILFFATVAVFAAATVISVKSAREKAFQYAVCMLRHRMSGQRVYAYLVNELGEDDAELIYKRACCAVQTR